MGWWSRILKNWRALGAWFHRRLRTLLTRIGVHWNGRASRVLGRFCVSVLRMRLAMTGESSGGGGGEVVKLWEVGLVRKEEWLVLFESLLMCCTAIIFGLNYKCYTYSIWV